MNLLRTQLARRWPALLVATVAAAVPMTVAMAQDFPGFSTFGPSTFSLKNVGYLTAGAAITADGQASGGVRNGITATGEMGLDASGTLFGVRASAKPGTDATGLRAEANKVAVPASSFSDRAVVGGGLKIGVEGIGTGGDTSIGVRGASGTGVKAEGIGAHSVGVDATGQSVGVSARSFSGTGLAASSAGANGVAVSAYADQKGSMGVNAFGDSMGVYGEGLKGVVGHSNVGLGGEFSGPTAPIRLAPATKPGAPTTGAHQRGELYVDSAGQLFLCTADSTAGNAGTWKQVVLK